MAKRITRRNKLLFNQAKKYLVGGVDSPVRSFNYVGLEPLIIKKAKGAKVYDYDENNYLDYVLSYGAVILGHAHPEVIRSINKSAKKGLNFGATNLGEIELAALIRKAIPNLEKIRFVNSGTEAVIGAIRLARGYTKRDKIVKLTNSYHGHADYLLVKGGSGLASSSIPNSAGVPAAFLRDTLVSNYGDKSMLEDIFRKYGQDIAGIIVEPVGGNFGVIAPDEGYLKYLSKISKQYRALLIFDEVITGFRFNLGTAADILGIKPDLVCLGKIIGAGLPIGAFGGKAEIMDNLSPLGDVYQASTFGGNPVVMQAGVVTLKILATLRRRYKNLRQKTETLVEAVKQLARHYGINLSLSHYESMFSFRFKQKEIFSLFYKKMLDRNVYFAPSEYEANFLSFAHTDRDIDYTIDKIKNAFKGI